MFKPTMRNLEQLAEHLRSADKIELTAATGKDVLSVLKRSVEISTICYVDHPDQPNLIFGLSTFPEPRSAGIWMVGTDEIENQPIKFCRTAKAVINGFFELSDTIDYLCNYTHIDNVVHHKWLKWLGATLGPAMPYGPDGVLFRPFILKRK